MVSTQTTTVFEVKAKVLTSVQLLGLYLGDCRVNPLHDMYVGEYTFTSGVKVSLHLQCLGD